MIRFGLLLGAFCVLAGGVARAQSLEIYGKLPGIEAVDVSPDGSKAAVILSDGASRTILIKDLVKNTAVENLRFGEEKVTGLTWVGEDHLLILTTKTALMADITNARGEYALVFDFNLKTRKFRPLLGDADLNILTGAPFVRTIEGKPALFLEGVHFVENRGVASIYQINLDRDSSKLIATGLKGAYDWFVSADGDPIAQSTHNDGTGRWRLKVKTSTGWRDSRVVEDGDDAPAVLGLGRDGRSILMGDMVDGVRRFREVSPEGVWGEPLPLAATQGAIFDPEDRRLIGGYALAGDEKRYVFFDPADQRVWDAVCKAYPGESVDLVSWSADRKKIVVLVDSPTQGPAYALVDLTTKQASWLGPRYEKLTSANISPVKPVKFLAKDGLDLSGYLTLPKGAEARNLPLVVFPHGGPAARDTLGYDWWAQAMASRGYAVLQVNFRGSDGFGQKFLEAGFGQWGRKMQTDLSDGVRYLGGQGVIDPKRVCIVGASYGGYAALAGITLDPGVYRCAASYGGISDLKAFADWLRTKEGRSSERYLDRFIGAETSKDPTMLEVSPRAHTAAANAPILLVHGKDDTVVPLEQSRWMADALKAAGKPVEFVVLDSTDHWLTKGETRLAMLNAVVAFLEKNNPPH